MVRKARVFADPEKGYTKKELRKLLALCRQHQAVFGLKHMIRLLSIPKGEGKRERLLRETIENGWSVTTLNEAIRATFGTRKDGGRAPHRPRSPEELLAMI